MHGKYLPSPVLTVGHSVCMVGFYTATKPLYVYMGSYNRRYYMWFHVQYKQRLDLRRPTYAVDTGRPCKAHLLAGPSWDRQTRGFQASTDGPHTAQRQPRCRRRRRRHEIEFDFHERSAELSRSLLATRLHD